MRSLRSTRNHHRKRLEVRSPGSAGVPPAPDVKRIALFLPNWVGDVVMATPAIRAIHEAFPAADLVAVCKPYVADVLSGAPWFRATILADKHGPRSQRLLAVARK